MTWLITNEDGDYWSNSLGWVEKLDLAEVFTTRPTSLPVGGRLVELGSDEFTDYEVRLMGLLREAIVHWPQFDLPDEEVNGGELVEWFAAWRQRAITALTPPDSLSDANLEDDE